MNHVEKLLLNYNFKLGQGWSKLKLCIFTTSQWVIKLW